VSKSVAANAADEDASAISANVLFNVPGSELAYSQMEELIFDEPAEVLH